MYLANCIEMIDLYLACVKLGVIFVPINILYRDREITHILTDADPVAVVSSTEFTSPFPIWNPADLTCAAAALPNKRPIVPLDGDAPAGIIYTSGTTGTSKGAVLTHNGEFRHQCDEISPPPAGKQPAPISFHARAPALPCATASAMACTPGW